MVMLTYCRQLFFRMQILVHLGIGVDKVKKGGQYNQLKRETRKLYLQLSFAKQRSSLNVSLF